MILLRDLEQQNQSLNTGVEVSRVGDSVKGIDMREEQFFRKLREGVSSVHTGKDGRSKLIGLLLLNSLGGLGHNTFTTVLTLITLVLPSRLLDFLDLGLGNGLFVVPFGKKTLKQSQVGLHEGIGNINLLVRNDGLVESDD